MGLRKHVPLKDRTGRGYAGTARSGIYTDMGPDWCLERFRAGDVPVRKVPTGKTFKYVTTYDELDLLMDSYMVRPSELGKLADELTQNL